MFEIDEQMNRQLPTEYVLNYLTISGSSFS